MDQAKMLANKEPLHSKQASLRRAVSTAYYAIFHLMMEDAANALAPPLPQGLRSEIKRSFAHSQIKTACKEFLEANTIKSKNIAGKTKLPAALEALIAFPLDINLVTVLDAFIALQEARHEADYNLSYQWIRLDVLANLNLAEQAFSAWPVVRGTPNAAVFISNLAFRKEWRNS